MTQPGAGQGGALERKSVVRHGRATVFVALDDRGVVYDESDFSVHEFDPVSWAVWERIDGGSVQRLWDRVAADLPGARFTDLEALLRQLAGLGLISVDDPGAGDRA